MSDLTSAINSELGRSLSGMNGIVPALAALVANVRRPPRARPRIASLDEHLLRDIGYTPHGIREMELAEHNEARF